MQERVDSRPRFHRRMRGLDLGRRSRLGGVRLLAVLIALQTAPLGAQTVHGIVVGASDGSPIGDARLVLRNEDGVVVSTAASATNGRFVLTLRSGGSVRLGVSHIGFRDWETEPFEVAGDADIEVEVKLGVEAIPLEPITVVARSSAGLGPLAGYRERMSDPTLRGYFIEDEAIERRPMAKPTDLVLGVPGMSVGLASSAAGMDRGVILGTNGCVARTFVDGVHIQQAGGVSIDDLLTPDRIAGVEVYPRGLGAPVQYTSGPQSCGVVLFWSKPAQLDEDRGWGTTRILLGVGLLLGIVTLAVVS